MYYGLWLNIYNSLSFMFKEGLNLEKESEKKREVARVFILRSRPTNEIKKEIESGAEPSDVFFTTAMWMEKNSESVNPGQVMPVGGKKKDWEKIEETAQREMLEETHLRPLDVDLKFIGKMDYKIFHSRKKEKIPIEASFFVGNVPPLDEAYPLNPAEDKVEDFHHLDLKQTAELFTKGKFEIEPEKKTVFLLDSLNITAEGKKEENLLDADSDSASEISGELLSIMEEKEANKKINVLTHFLDLSGAHEEEKNKWKRRLASSVDKKGLGEGLWGTQTVIKDFWKKYGDFKNKDGKNARGLFCEAADLSNFEEEVGGERAGKSEIEAVLRCIYALLETSYLSDKYLEIAKKNKKLSKFIGKLEMFANKISSSEKSFFGKIKKIGELTRDMDTAKQIEEDFMESFGVEKDALFSKFDRINSFLDYLVDSAISPKIDIDFHHSLVKTLNEVRNFDLEGIIKMAFPAGDEEWKERFKDENFSKEELKRKIKEVVFEARRQLVLLYLFAETDKHYEERKNLGNAPIEKVFSDVFKGATVNKFLDYKKDNEILEDVEVKDDVLLGRQKAELRKFKNKNYLASIETDTKKIESVYRKAVERGLDDPKNIIDIFRREIVLHPLDADLKKMGEMKKFADLKKDFSDIKIFEAKRDKEGKLEMNGGFPILIEKEIKQKDGEEVPAILELISEIAKHHGIKIFDYKPTGGNGNQAKKRSVGSGGDIRFAKFYIQYTGGNNVYYEEIQVFAPSEDGHSGFYFERQKKEDDKRYGDDRLYKTKGLRSLIELLFPVGIYGKPIHDAAFKNLKKK